MGRRKGRQTSSRFTRVSDGSFTIEERFKRSETLRVPLPFLSKSLKKALLYRCEKAKVHTCMATESKQIPGLNMAKLDFPGPLLVVSSCFRRLYGASMHMAGRKQRSLFL